MESVGQTMSHMNRAHQLESTDLSHRILADQEVATFIKDQSLFEQEIRRSIQNLINTLVNANCFY